MEKESKNSTKENVFYFKVLNALKETTNLSKIQEDLNLSKQNLNYYLRQLKSKGMVINPRQGFWELTKESKNLTKYQHFLPKDFIRGHAYVIEIKLPKEIKEWDKRIEILKKNNIHFKLVGAKLDVPRIKVLGRKVWLCKDHLRIFDTKDASYYGINAIEGRKQAFWTFYKIVSIIENKFGIIIKPFDFEWKKEHYALIKNDLAIDQNRKGIIWRIADETGEWILIDDSLGEGGELENIGKQALTTNVKMSKWWNENKQTNFEVTPKFVLESLGKMIQVQNMNSQNIIKHQKVLDEMLLTLKEIRNYYEKKV